jgi:DNA-binding NarL/FixJ family response regulator
VSAITLLLVVSTVVYNYLIEKSYSQKNGRQFIPSSDQPDRQTMSEHPHNKQRFWNRCQQIIVGNGLTKREEDIFLLLAKGRNAESISNKLFISVATAKTHIHHIYTKLSISSHQELLDLVDRHPEE